MKDVHVFITTTRFNNLTRECIVLLRSFYCEKNFILVDHVEKSDFKLIIETNTIQVEYEEDSFTKEINESIDLRLFVKQTLYDYFSMKENRKLPWGILQGIRPTKLVFKLLKNLSSEEVKNVLISKYRLSRKMADLCLNVVSTEEPIVKSIKESKDLKSIYIGIPFCPSRCLYCSFTSNEVSKWKDRMDEYVEGLIAEWDGYWLNMGHERCQVQGHKIANVNTLYIGGGTPTTLSVEQLEKLLRHINSYIELSDLEEFTIEAGRPNTITMDKLKLFKKYHVSRLSINPQTMHDVTLKVIGRDHLVQDVVNAFNMARGVSDWRINMDIIVGLPGEKLEEVLESLKQIELLEPDEITVHTLAIKRSSRLHEQLEEFPLPQYQVIDRILGKVSQYMSKNQYKPYYLYRQKNIAGGHENVGYYKGAKPGIYNISIMEEIEDIIAFGAGTVSKFVDSNNVYRQENVKNVEIYLNSIPKMVEKKMQEKAKKHD